MKWGPQAKLIDEALLKYYFVNIYFLPRYIFILVIKSIHIIKSILSPSLNLPVSCFLFSCFFPRLAARWISPFHF